MKDSKD